MNFVFILKKDVNFVFIIYQCDILVKIYILFYIIVYGTMDNIAGLNSNNSIGVVQ